MLPTSEKTRIFVRFMPEPGELSLIYTNMGKVLIIGAGGVGTVVAHKVAQNSGIFTDIMLASRTKSKCDAIAAEVKKRYGVDMQTAQVDADSVPALVELFRSFGPELVINVALPYQDLTIMDACLECGVNYLDTANYEPKDEAHFEYSWQWAYQDRFKQAGLTAILGCGFDPGVTSVFTAYAAKHRFDEMQYLDIVDCNAGDHGKAFATNFNPEINIREVTQKGKYWENGQWVWTEPHEIHQPLNYPEIGPKESYVIYHEELESLVKNFPTLRRARFWMTFGQEYLTHLRVIQNIGRRGGLQRREDCAHPVPQGRAAQPRRTGRTLHGLDFHRLPHPRAEGRPGTYLLYI